MNESQRPPDNPGGPPPASPGSWSASGPPPTPYGAPPPAPPPRTSGQGTAALITGLFGILACCHVVSPVAWYLGHDAVRDIRAGRVMGPETNAKIGMILGIVGTILFAVDLLWAFVFGGLAFMARFLGGHLNTGHGF